MNFFAKKTAKKSTGKSKHPLLASLTRSFVIFVSLCGTLPFLDQFALFGTFLSEPNPDGDALSFSKWVPIGLYLFAVLIALWKQQTKTLVFGLAFGHFLALAHLLNSLEIPVHPGFLSIGAQIGFVWFAMKGRVLSLGTLAFSILVFFWEPTAPIRTIIAVLLSAAIIRYLALAVIQNLAILKRLGLTRTTSMALKSSLYWAPLLIFAIPAYLATKAGHRAVTNAIYATADPRIFLEQDDKKKPPGPWWDPFQASVGDQFILALAKEEKSTEEIRSDLIDRTCDFFNDARIKAKGSLTVARDQTANDGRLLRKRAIDSFETVVPTTSELGLDHESCGALALDCHAANIARSVVRRSYSNGRSKARYRLERRVDQEIKGPSGKANKKISAIQASIEEEIDSVRDETILVLKRTFDTIDFLSLIFDFLFVFLCVKSFLYVFARVACATHSPVDVTLRESPGEQAPLGEILKWGSNYIINGEDPIGFYISRRFEPRGRPPKLAFPQPSAATLARLRHGSFAMNHIETGPGMDNVDFSAVNGAQFVEWLLVPGETVVFDHRNLVGFSENLRISSIISMRVTSLLMGRLIFQTASGPGRLILMASGEPTAGFEERTSSSMTPNRLLAWQKTARFSVESEESLRDIYFSGFYLRKNRNDLVIVDADRIGKPGQGLGRFIKYFLLPW